MVENILSCTHAFIKLKNIDFYFKFFSVFYPFIFLRETQKSSIFRKILRNKKKIGMFINNRPIIYWKPRDWCIRGLTNVFVLEIYQPNHKSLVTIFCGLVIFVFTCKYMTEMTLLRLKSEVTYNKLLRAKQLYV